MTNPEKYDLAVCYRIYPGISGRPIFGFKEKYPLLRLNLETLGEIKRAAGGINILIIRPLEVVAALQALNLAYFNYYGVIAEYNRAQFRMYRALGNPAQLLVGRESLSGPLLKKE